MSSENEDRSSEEKPRGNDDARKHPKKPQVSYARDFLLSVAELDACKKLPTGFDIYILREVNDHSTSSLQDCHSSGTHSLQNNRYCPLLQIPEDGILGSGTFRRLPACKTVTSPLLKDNGFHLLNRSTEPYRPPSLSKVKQHALTENDQYNNETFGLSKDLREQRIERENRRRDSFLLMRKKQQMTIQESRETFCEGVKENLNPDIATTFGKPENDEMRGQKYGKSEETEMLVAADDLSEVSKIMRTTASQFLPPDDSSRPMPIASNLTQAFIDGEKQQTCDQEDERNFEQLSSGMDELVPKFEGYTFVPSATRDGICGPLIGPKQAGRSGEDSIDMLLSEIHVCCAIQCLSNSNCTTDFTEDLGSSFLENSAASLDFVPLPQDGLGVDMEERLSLNVDDDEAKLDDSSGGRVTNFLDNPTSGSILELQSKLETELGQGDSDDVCLPEEDELIRFDDYCICLPEEDDLISFEDYQLVPQEGQYSSPVAAKDTSSSPDDSAEQVVLGACLTNKRSDISSIEDRFPDPVSMKNPSNIRKVRQSNSSILPTELELNPVIPCFHQSSQESRKSSKAMSWRSKAYDGYSKSPHCFPAYMLADAFQNPEPAATRFDYSVNYPLLQHIPIPSSFPAYQQFGLPRNGRTRPCAQAQNPLSYPLQNCQQLPYYDLDFQMPDLAWQCW